MITIIYKWLKNQNCFFFGNCVKVVSFPWITKEALPFWYFKLNCWRKRSRSSLFVRISLNISKGARPIAEWQHRVFAKNFLALFKIFFLAFYSNFWAIFQIFSNSKFFSNFWAIFQTQIFFFKFLSNFWETLPKALRKAIPPCRIS